MTRVAVLGATGMLGSMLVDVLAADPDLEVVATTRTGRPSTGTASEWRTLDAANAPAGSIADSIAGAEWVVNAIGLIKQRIDEANPAHVRDAVQVNGLFPYELAGAAAQQGARVIQIATDCVFSGTRGGYRESDPHDALDVYGKTKSLGEVPSEVFRHLRCSIIGPERETSLSLLGWFLGQERAASISGFENHRWNGVTTLHFARLCAAIVKAPPDLPSPIHVVPRDQVTKAQLLQTFARGFDRTDVTIEVVDAEQPVDRTLVTEFVAENERLWGLAGYQVPPGIEEMVDELAEFEATR